MTPNVRLGSQFDKITWAAVIVFFLGLSLRLMGIGWGLPSDTNHYGYHPDEYLNYRVSEAVVPGKGQFTPGYYNYGTLFFTTLAVSNSLVAAYSGGPEEQPEKRFGGYIRRCFLGGRLISALCGSGLAALVVLILKRWTRFFGALMGGLAMAFAPGAVVHSCFMTPDIPAAFLGAVGAFFALRLAAKEGEPEPKWMRDAIWAGVFIGLSAGMKYVGFVALIILVVVGWRRWAPMAAGVGASLAVFVLCCPAIFLDSQAFWRDVHTEMTHVAEGHGLTFVGTSNGFVYHLGNLAIGLGPLMLLAGLIGLIYAGVRRRSWAVAMGLFALVFFLIIGREEVKFLRYTFPLYLPLTMGLGWLVGQSHERGGWLRVFVVLGILGVGGVEGGGANGSFRRAIGMGTVDPRDQAAAHLKEIGKGKTAGFVSDPWYYSPPVFPETGAPRFEPKVLWSAVAASKDPHVLRFSPLNFNDRFDWDVRLLDLKPDYVVFTDFEIDAPERFIRNHTRGDLPDLIVKRYLDFRDRLTNEYTPDSTFGSRGVGLVQDMMYIRPEVWVWKRKTP